MKTPSEILKDLKKLLFEDTPPPPAEPKVYKLEDGTEVTIDKLEVGGTVKIGENPAPAGTLKLEDGSSLVVDEAGVITEVVPKAEPAPAAAAANPVDLNVVFTEEGMNKAFEKFATGTPEERCTNLEAMCKALMQYCYGWKIDEAQRKADEDAAIAVYKDALKPVQEKVDQQKELMGKMLELMEQFIKEPQDNPTEQKKKFSFSKETSKEDRLKNLSETMKKLKQTA